MSRTKNTCHCHTCVRDLDSLGIMSHRAMHKRKEENCTITFSTGKTVDYVFKKESKPFNDNKAFNDA